MTVFISSLTLLFLAIPVYVYVGYPAILFLADRICRGRTTEKADITPSVTMIVSCFNEEDVIQSKIENCLALDYPPHKLEYLFVSDGSTDNTDEMIKARQDNRLRLVRQEGRLGKTSGLNLAVPQAKGEMIVFSDANAMYDLPAIRKLMRNFNDADVGYVVGAAIYKDEDTTAAGESEDIYWRYELFLKTVESKLHSVVGGDGAIYAIRKALYEQLSPEDINDFVNPLQIIEKGYRGIFEPEALCFERTAGEFEKEARRKRRIVNRSFSALLKHRSLLNPFKFGLFSFELWSHKLLRWLIPVFLTAAACGALYLAFGGQRTFQIVVLLGVLLVWAIMFGTIARRLQWVPTVLLLPYYFYVVNLNAMIGVIRALQGEVQITWSTPRDDQSTENNLAVTAAGMLVIFGLSLYLFVRFMSALSAGNV